MSRNTKRTIIAGCIAVMIVVVVACSPESPQVPVTGPTLSSLVTQAGTGVSNLQTTVATVGPGLQTQVAPVIPQAQTQVATIIPGAKTAVAPAVNGVQTAVATVFPGANPPAVTGNVVKVTEKEYQISMPVSIPAGVTTFEVTNNGTIAHSLEIDGTSMIGKLPHNLEPGQSNSLTVTLQPGSYQVFCPVPGHKEQGMLVNLTVTP